MQQDEMIKHLQDALPYSGNIKLEEALTQAIDQLSGECTWKQWSGYDEGDTWSTSCGEDFTYIEGTPKENNANYCHGCGKKIVEVKAQPPEES